MGDIPYPRNNRLPHDTYSNPEHTFHVVFRAMPGTAPFRGALGPAIWSLILAETDRTAVQLLAACLMPDHLHTIVKPAGRTIPNWVRGFKSYSTRAAWQSGAKRALWQPGFYDRQIRDEAEYPATLQYILDNPANAHLENWPFVYPGS